MFPMKLILIGACLVCLTSATLESERLQNTITTQFYQMTPAQWTPLTSRFKDILLIDLNGYCRNNPAACGINNNLTLYKNFSASDIVFSPAPRQNKHYLVISLYVTLPAGGSLSTPQLTQFVLYKNALMDIMNTSRPDINRDLGFDVVQIGLDEYYKSPDRQMNVVMIPISFVVLLIIICITVGLECYSKRKEKEEKRQQRIQKQHDRKLETQAKNNKTKVGPSPEETPNHILENETDKPARWNSSSRESFNKMALTADDKPDETGATNQPNGIDGVEVDAVDGVGIVVVGTADGAERTDSPPPPDYSTDNGGLDMNGIVETEADNYLNSESGAGDFAELQMNDNPDSLGRKTLPPIEHVEDYERRQRKHKKRKSPKNRDDENNATNFANAAFEDDGDDDCHVAPPPYSSPDNNELNGHQGDIPVSYAPHATDLYGRNITTEM